VLTALNHPLTDLGGVSVLWDSDVGTLVQDPTQGGTNAYGPGDLFRDPASGDLYQLTAGGQLDLYRVAAAPLVPNAPQGVALPAISPVGGGISSAGRSWGDTTQPPPTGAITPTGNPTRWMHQAVDWLSRSSFISGLPNGLLLAGGYVGYSMLRQRRRGRGF
jgi:hypothetical protein